MERAICPICGAELSDEGYTDDKGNECLYCTMCNKYLYPNEVAYEDCDDDDDIPFCCKACGGPYPDCMSSCKIFDD